MKFFINKTVNDWVGQLSSVLKVKYIPCRAVRTEKTCSRCCIYAQQEGSNNNIFMTGNKDTTSVLRGDEQDFTSRVVSSSMSYSSVIRFTCSKWESVPNSLPFGLVLAPREVFGVIPLITQIAS